jgi:uncharacterized protein
VETFFFGDESRRLFGALTRPVDTIRAGVVFCPPFGDEMVCTYSRLAQWGKELAEEGFAMLRYHPFGTGESDGDCADFTLQGASDDTLTAAKWMRQTVCPEPLGLFGLRLGAAVAVQAATRVRPDFLILWSPIINLRRYFRELLRLRLTKEMVHQKADRVRLTANDMIAELEAGRTIDIVGYDIAPEFYRQMSASETWAEQPPAPRVLWVARPQEESLASPVVERWRKHGGHVDFLALPDPVFWEDFSSGMPEKFAQATLRWMAELIAQPAVTR